MKRWDGVADGTRTHDNQNHNLGLYQLSYSHRRARKYSGPGGARDHFVAADAADGLTSTLNRLFSAA